MLLPGDLALLWSPERGDRYLVKVQPGASQGTQLGAVPHALLLERSFGDVVHTHLGKPLMVLRPSLAEFCLRVKRRTQVIYPKEAGYLLMYLGIAPGATVVECGSGSGGFTTVLAHFVGPQGRVVSYERRPEFQEIARNNVERWGVGDRVTFKVRDIAEGFDETGAHAVFLDVPTPWEYLEQTKKALLPGGRLGILVPTFNQIQQSIEALRAGSWVDIEALEILLRHLKTNPARLRPEDTMVGHTGYLVFASSVSAEAAQALPWGEDASELSVAPEACSGDGPTPPPTSGS